MFIANALLFEGLSMNNRKHLLATLICSGAIVASVNVIAQSYGQDSRQRPDTGRGTTMSGSGTGAQQESANNAFKRLDANKRGYLTNDDVRSMQGFDTACDKNTDGRITRSEFRPCYDSWSANRPSDPNATSTPSGNRSNSTPNSTTGTGSGNNNTGTGSSGTGTSGSGPGSVTPGNATVPSPGASGSQSTPGASPPAGSSGNGTGSGSGR
jgi:hypothetical protein